jgi:hypothetical protein
MDFLSDAKTGMAIRDGVVVATVKLQAEAGRRGSGVWKTLGYETQAAVDVSKRARLQTQCGHMPRSGSRRRRPPAAAYAGPTPGGG